MPELRDSLRRMYVALDSQPALSGIVLGDSSVWVYLYDRESPRRSRAIQAELDDFGNVLRCEKTVAFASQFGRQRALYVASVKDRENQWAMFTAPIPPLCPVHRLDELRDWIRRTDSTR